MKKLALFLCLAMASSALAQVEPPNTPVVKDDGGPPRVYFAHSYYAEHWDMAGLDDRVSIHVQNFANLLKQTGGNCNGIVLFVDGMSIKGLQPESCDNDDGHVRFRLQRPEGSDAAWHAILGRPQGFSKTVSMSVGASDQFSIPSTARMRIEIIPRIMFYTFVLILVGGLLFFVYLCRTKGLIRSGDPAQRVSERRYSLSLFQMAFWFFLVIAAYVFIWMIADELNTISDSVLGLLGIGAATAVGAAVIDKNKTSPQAVASTMLPSQGFIKDVLRDDSDGISLHRFQMFVWTLVLGVIFCASVYSTLEMPEFSATLLGLMGISSGTYLGFKVPETNSAPDKPQAGPPP